ncbi:MAG: helix-turn-helix transcriptional regulator [Magnetococcales bacterium]|nr:helix-turn-helix transcriptional regulator [Magnetococcales bacterium]
MPTLLSEKIKRLRKEKGLTLEQLGELTGSSKSYIWALENQNPPRPSAEKIQKIAEVLGVTGEFLLDQDQETPERGDMDLAFFRKYQKMPEDTKRKLQQLIDVWGEEDKK